MKGKRLLLVNLVLLVLLLATPALVTAAPPVPPAPQEGTPPSDPAQLGLPVPPDIQPAIELRSSLTDAQRAAIGDVLQKYAPELEAISKSLLSADAANKALPSAARRPAAPSKAQRLEMREAVRTTQKVEKQLADVKARIDEDLKAILTPEQWAKNQEIVSSLKTPGGPLAEADATLALPQADVSPALPLTDASPAYNATYCYYAGLYGSVALYYSYLAYYYAYYNYTYYGTSYGYAAYYYAYYAYTNDWYGLQRSGAGYFDLLALGSDMNGFLGNAINSWYYNYLYSGYARSYAAADYNNTGHTLAYYAYLFSDYTNDYAWPAYYYSYYCYYG